MLRMENGWRRAPAAFSTAGVVVVKARQGVCPEIRGFRAYFEQDLHHGGQSLLSGIRKAGEKVFHLAAGGMQ
jgi:hypothetical protein